MRYACSYFHLSLFIFDHPRPLSCWSLPQDRGVVGLMSQLDHTLPPLLARGKKDTQPALALALARSPNKCAQATAGLTLLAQQLALVKHLPLQVIIEIFM